MMTATSISKPAHCPLVAGNWKMNLLTRHAREVVRELVATISAGPRPPEGAVLVCPPFTTLGAVAEELAAAGSKAAGVALGAQDLYWEPGGAYTGEVSGPMLADLGCAAVIVGHSERRAHFAETDGDVGRKAAAALAAGLYPVICVGETIGQRRADETRAVVVRQVRGAVEQLAPEDVARGLVFAYEPIWAIGTGSAATPNDAVQAAGLIRGCLPPECRGVTRVLYGGSVKSSNVAGFMARPEVDGVLVGGASLNGREFGLLALAGLKAAQDGR